uniref:Uncharacterized protein n=1 Tax=Magallana gigas TaxID=29159 RepID=K1PJL7_MAGGI
MAEKKSSLFNDIRRTHNALLAQLIIDHVGNDTSTETYINWKTKFKDHCDNTRMLNLAVTANCQHLELMNIISPGKYDALRDIFSEDPEALSKINNAADEIQRMESAAQFSDIKTKGVFFVDVSCNEIEI